jgi:hypothetical protein
MASHYKTKHLMMTMGADLAYLYADLSYKYIEDIVELLTKNDNSSSTK